MGKIGKIDRVGETMINSDGIKMTIIEYRSGNDMDIEFEEGTIKCHVKYCNFRKGYVKTPQEVKDNIAEKKFELEERKRKKEQAQEKRRKKLIGTKYYVESQHSKKKDSDISKEQLEVCNWLLGSMSHGVVIIGKFERAENGEITCIGKCTRCNTIMRYDLAKMASRECRCKVCNRD